VLLKSGQLLCNCLRRLKEQRKCHVIRLQFFNEKTSLHYEPSCLCQLCHLIALAEDMNVFVGFPLAWLDLLFCSFHPNILQHFRMVFRLGIKWRKLTVGVLYATFNSNPVLSSIPSCTTVLQCLLSIGKGMAQWLDLERIMLCILTFPIGHKN